MPRFGFISDIHANLPALTSALEIFRLHEVDFIYCIGDIIGYGTKPEECCRMVRKVAHAVVAGNHEHAVCDRFDYSKTFSPSAIMGIQYAKKYLTEESLRWVMNLPLVHHNRWLEMVHASLELPEQFRYLRNTSSGPDDILYQEVSSTFMRMERPVCFVGHSHFPLLYIDDGAGRLITQPAHERTIFLDGLKAVVNVGSVGTPRTHDQRGCAVIYDSDSNSLRFHKFAITPSHIPERIAAELDWPDW